MTWKRRIAALLVLGALAYRTPAAEADKARGIDTLLGRYSELGMFNGAALVAEQGRVIFKKGFGLADFEWKIPNTPDTRFRLGSITKQFTATLILQLVEEGKLSLDQKLASALPYYRKDTGEKVTIHQLLNHTSGIPSYTGLPNFIKDVSRNPYAVREFVEKYCSGDLEFEPGAKFVYDNSGYFLLGAIVEQATGKPYEDVLRQRIFGPLGMKASGYDRSGVILEKRARGYERRLSGITNADYLDMSLPYAAGSLYSTVEDLFLWDQALYGEKVLPERAKEKMFAPGLESYGYGWNIRKEPIGPGKAERVTIGHGGGINGFNTVITRVPEDHHLVVLLNNTGGTSLNAMSVGVLDILYGRMPAGPKRPVAEALYETVSAKGVQAAIARYRELRAANSADFDLSGPQLNGLGRELLRQKRVADAIEVLKLAVEMFPTRPGSYDGLGDAYRELGNTELAIQNYRKVIELDPDNKSVAEKLEQLKQR